MADKKSFILYCDLLENIESLSMSQRGELLTAILLYENEKELPEMDGLVKLAFSFIKLDLDRNAEKYNAICEKRREVGKLGGAPKGNKNALKQPKQPKQPNGFENNQNNQMVFETTKNNQKQAKQPDNDNDNVNDNDNDNEINIYKKNTKKKHGSFLNVCLSDEELERLINDFDETDVMNTIEDLSCYMKSKGKRYKDHCATIRNWLRKKEGEMKKTDDRQSKVDEDKGIVFDIEKFMSGM